MPVLRVSGHHADEDPARPRFPADRVDAASLVLRVPTVRVPGADKVDKARRGAWLEQMGRGDYQVMDRERVLKALRCLSNPFDEKRDCDNCSYDFCSCVLDVTADALELLKAQEPRVLMLEEVMALPNGEEDEAVVVREFRLPISKVWNGETVCIWMGARDVQNVADWVYGFFHKSEYGHNWRCWTTMPTKAQRKAVKWNG